MCVLACTNSALLNADADTDGEGSDHEWWTKTKHKGIRARSQRGALVCGGSGRFGENRSFFNFFHDMEEQCFEENYRVYVWGRSERMSRRS